MSCSDSAAIMCNFDCGKVPAVILSIFFCECGTLHLQHGRGATAATICSKKDEASPLAATHLSLARISHAMHHLSAPDPLHAMCLPVGVLCKSLLWRTCLFEDPRSRHTEYHKWAMLRNLKFALIFANLTNNLGLTTGNRCLGRHHHAC